MNSAIVTVQNVAGTALTNTTTETVIPTAAQCQGNRTIPANFLKVGSQIRVVARGIYTTPTGADTINMRVRYGGTGGTQLAATGAVDPNTAAVTDVRWDLDVVMTVRSTGATGTLVANGFFKVVSSGTAGTVRWWEMGGNTTVTFDTTTATAIDLTAQWGTAATTFSITCTEFSVEVVS